ncbi:ABC transporter substrate-binding protein [Leucobacter sp. wl10]|uniref:ABC transporter substrate-binding protein n=1 Tax=Leucobacter sp. wl10 TaxID=2304677 RepID=UPI000E5BE7A1|nr:extracellular solute-binding protein [Leucobacter sp. wl10]RGE18955.1 extracellular solute-binding protein [Leucobacter sp. wl10]
MKYRGGTLLAAAAAAALTLAGCSASGGSGGTFDDASLTETEVESLGGRSAVDEMAGLYAQAVEAGETTVTVYGAGENDKGPLYERFTERFPGIDVVGEYLVGPDLASRLEGEAASGQRTGDVINSGDTAVLNALNQGWVEPFRPKTAEGLPEEYSSEDGAVNAPFALAFGFAYNPELLGPDEVPAGWQDLLDPRLAGKMVTEDARKNGASFSALSKIMNDGRLGDDYVERLAAQDISFESTVPVAGQLVAAGQYALNPVYPLSFYMRDAAEGAPIEFVFPTEGGVHMSPHYAALLADAPNPTAAKLLLTWLFTPEAQAAAAEIAYYPLMPGAPGPADFPAADQLDLFAPFRLEDVNAITAKNLDTVKAVFSD